MPLNHVIDIKFRPQSMDDAEFWGILYDEPDPDAEPECHCDIQKLAGSGHDTGCRWLKWNDDRKRAKLA